MHYFGQANATAQEVFAGIDDTTYLDSARVWGIDQDDINHRVVGLETIIPAIYRYEVEECGVTIIDKDGNLIARYDTTTDSVARTIKNYKSFENEKNPNRKEVYKSDYKTFLSHMEYLNNIVSKYVPSTNNKKTITVDDYTYTVNLDMIGTIENLYTYKVNEDTTYYGAPWSGGLVAERIKADLTGKEYNFDVGTYNPFENESLISKMQGKKYTEYIIEDALEYEAKDYSDQFNAGETTSSTTRATTKQEIIFVEK